MPLRSWPIRLLRGARSRDGSRSIRPAPETISLVTRRAQPAAATVARLTITAVVAFVVARLVTDTAYPVIAPLTAMLVVQVTLYRTFWSALQRVASVVAGVLVALGLSHALGLTWWSLGITVAAALIIGMVLRLGDSMLEVPISAMLILSLGSEELAAARVLETFIGAATGLASGLLFAPLRVQPAEEAIDELGARLGSLLDQMSAELTKEPSRDRSNEWLARARQLTDELDEVEDALGEAEESVRLNPRSALVVDPRIYLRRRLESMGHVTLAVRAIARSLRDSTALEGDANPLRDEQVARRVADVLRELAAVVRSYGRLARSKAVDRSALKADIDRHLAAAAEYQKAAADVLRTDANTHPVAWPLRGELVIHLDRLRNELRPAPPVADGRTGQRPNVWRLPLRAIRGWRPARDKRTGDKRTG